DDGDIFGESLALELEVDSGSEIDEDLTQEELLEILEDPVEEDELPEGPEGFTWEDNFEYFRGVKEEFNEPAGRKIEGTNPMDISLQIWDQPIMELIVEQTNLYAWQSISAASEIGISIRSRLNG
ncbi:hypothetical protein ABMA28_003580, partial [Loxostege sticticalis]